MIWAIEELTGSFKDLIEIAVYLPHRHSRLAVGVVLRQRELNMANSSGQVPLIPHIEYARHPVSEVCLGFCHRAKIHNSA